MNPMIKIRNTTTPGFQRTHKEANCSSDIYPSTKYGEYIHDPIWSTLDGPHDLELSRVKPTEQLKKNLIRADQGCHASTGLDSNVRMRTGM